MLSLYAILVYYVAIANFATKSVCFLSILMSLLSWIRRIGWLSSYWLAHDPRTQKQIWTFCLFCDQWEDHSLFFYSIPCPASSGHVSLSLHTEYAILNYIVSTPSPSSGPGFQFQWPDCSRCQYYLAPLIAKEETSQMYKELPKNAYK